MRYETAPADAVHASVTVEPLICTGWLLFNTGAASNAADGPDRACTRAVLKHRGVALPARHVASVAGDTSAFVATIPGAAGEDAATGVGPLGEAAHPIDPRAMAQASSCRTRRVPCV